MRTTRRREHRKEAGSLRTCN
uniref:Uncharacterized protein n=1 Tax=Arundo donax TaxID=35708 RepID=A0A0A9FHN0_ARUDO